MKNYRLIVLFIPVLMTFFLSCSDKSGKGTVEEEVPESITTIEEDLNYPEEGFDIEGSDARAIVIADKVMKAMGGRKAWESTRLITWNFFGFRKLWWDKQTGDVRIEIPSQNLAMVTNLKDSTGKVWKNGNLMQDSLDFYLDQARKIWINDSYWLVMPFKMKDTGVTLTFVGEDTTQAGEMAEKIRLTFDQVGVTPQNLYYVWVSKEDSLVKQWAYYRNANDEAPGFVLPWGDYRKYGNIVLSGDRGERDLSDIEVLDEVPEGLFSTYNVPES
jgi:hypothetical protein